MKLFDDSGLRLARDRRRCTRGSLRKATARRERARRQSAWRIAWSAAFSAESEARHLPISVGRSIANGTVRLQAAPHGIPRPGLARLRAQGPAAHGHVRLTVELPGGALEISIRAAWKF